VATVGSWILVLGLIIFFANLVVAWIRGAKAGPNPWGGVTLEWTTASPPPVENFAVIPTITEAAYTFHPENGA